jgi:hypothetical protein
MVANSVRYAIRHFARMDAGHYVRVYGNSHIMLTNRG